LAAVGGRGFAAAPGRGAIADGGTTIGVARRVGEVAAALSTRAQTRSWSRFLDRQREVVITQLAAAVPEPASIALLGAGVAASLLSATPRHT